MENRSHWSDEQLAYVASDVYLELHGIGFEEVTQAAKECRELVPTSAGLPGLRHQMRRRALGFATRNLPPGAAVALDSAIV